MIVTDEEYGRALTLLRSWDTLDENPLLTGVFDSIEPKDDLIKKLWDSNSSWEETRQKLLTPPEENKKLPGGSKKSDSDT